jgi:hypothetical protein
MSGELLKRVGRAYLTGGLSELRRAAAKTGAPMAVLPLRGPLGGVLGFDKKPPVPVPVISAKLKRLPMRAKAIKFASTGPAGWLGWLVNHGAACFAAEIMYMDFHQSMISPRIKVSWHQADNDCGYVGAHASISAHADYLMTRRFLEPQCPAWGIGFGPNPIMNGGILDDKALEGLFTRMKDGDSCPTPGNYRANPNSAAYPSSNPLHERVRGRNPAERIADYVADWTDTETVRGRALISSLKLFTADDIKGLPELAALVEYGKGTTESFLRSRANKDHNLRIPDYWNAGEALRDQWAERVLRWFDTVVWLVWACECARLHSASWDRCPQWWRVFTNCWGIAVANQAYGDRIRYFELETTHENFARAQKACDIGNVSWERWEAVAKALIRAAGLPGDKGKCGEQIVETNKTRSILDMPGQCGDLRPATFIDGLLYHYATTWSSRQSFKEGATIAVGWINSIIGSVGSICGGSAVSSCMAAMNTAYAACGVLIRTIGSMANGGSLSGGDLVNLVGSLVSVTSAVAGATGVSVDEMLPDDVWEALTTAEAAIPEWGGELKDQVADTAIALQSDMCELRDVFNWPYLEEGFSFMVPGSADLLSG